MAKAQCSATIRRSRLIVPALCGSLLASPAAGQAAEIAVQTTRHGDSFEVKATAEIEADEADAWKVLTGYDRLAEFIPGVQESRILSRDGSKVVVDQRGEASLLFFKFPMRVRLAIEEFPTDRVESVAIAGNFKEMHGVYYLERLPSGVRLRYEGTFTPDFAVPPLIGTLLMRSTLEKRFAAMVHQIEKTRQREPIPGTR